jgi:hypothetical protein
MRSQNYASLFGSAMAAGATDAGLNATQRIGTWLTLEIGECGEMDQITSASSTHTAIWLSSTSGENQ